MWVYRGFLPLLFLPLVWGQSVTPGASPAGAAGRSQSVASSPGRSDSLAWKLTEETGEDLTRLKYLSEHQEDGRVEVQRLFQREALNGKLEPELQRCCMTDLEKWCSKEVASGRELECLQDRLVDLTPDCRDVVENLTQLQPQDIWRNALLMRACDAVIQAQCYEVAENPIDAGDLMECLVQNKHHRVTSEKCAAGVTLFQLIQMEDFSFSYKFKTACEEDVLRLCPNMRKKVDVMICLGAAVRNATMWYAVEQQVSPRCRNQLRVEEVAMSEDIRLQPELHDFCRQDIYRLCQNVAFGNAQVIECLKENKRLLAQQCHQKVFRLQEAEMIVPELDYTLMRVCKNMIWRFCEETDGRYILQCLKQNKNSELMDPKCKQMIISRQITQNTEPDYRLNPVLRRACRADIPKFCQSILNQAAVDVELEGQVISCLKLKYADQISGLCPEEAAAQEQSGQVTECLKINILKIKLEGCKMEVFNMLKESKADVFVDPVLHTACALDIKHHCAAIPPGKGRQMSCLMEALQDRRIRLQPECKKRLQDRIDMWSYAAKMSPQFQEFPIMEERGGPQVSRMLIIASVSLLLFIVCCTLMYVKQKQTQPSKYDILY